MLALPLTIIVERPERVIGNNALCANSFDHDHATSAVSATTVKGKRGPKAGILEAIDACHLLLRDVVRESSALH
jgi:hypothetical protein